MDKVENKFERNIGIDYFRFVSMFMVIILHVLGHGGLLNSGVGGFKYLGICFLESLCIIAVNCFALISGFVNHNKRFSVKKILNLWVQVFFINATISIIFYIAGLETFTVESLLNILFPILKYNYWYFTCYFMLLILMPFLNLIINKSNKATLLTVLGFIGIFIGILALFTGDFTLFDFANGYSVSWLAFLYLVGGAIHKYDLKIKAFDNKNILYLVLYVSISILSVVISSLSLMYLNKPTMFYYTNIFNFANSVILLMYFANVKVKSNKIISFLSLTSFGVYLIHEHMFIRKHFISEKFLKFSEYNIFVIGLIVVGSAVVIYICCAALEFLRQKLFNVIKINKLITKIDDVCSKKYNVFTNKIEPENKD